MGLLGGILKSLVNPASLMQLAMGPAGWASLAMKTIGAEILKTIISEIGQQFMASFKDINQARASIDERFESNGRSAHQAIQEYGEAVGASPSEIGRMQGQYDFVTQTIKNNIKEMNDNSSPERKEKLKGKGGLSWIQVMADSMSKILDASLEKLNDKSTSLVNTIKDGKGLKDDAAKDNQANTQKAQTDFTVASQEFNILMNSVNTAIKTIGEGLATMARKQ
jgi:hypothetical protein